MKFSTFLLFICCLIYSLSNLKAQDPGANTFTGLKIHTINLQFTQPNYWDSLTIYYNQGLERSIVATVTINGTVVDSVGARFKGNSTFSHPNNKKPFKLEFDEYRDDQKYDGMKSISLNNGYLDPTLIREKLHLDFCRDAGIAAPRGNFARVYINGVYWGVYTIVESVDKTFLKDRYDDNDGNLFKAVDAFTNNIFSDLRWYGATHSTYYNRYELKTNETENNWTDLVNFIDTINNNPNTATALPKVLNMNSFYKALAADNLFGNMDAYINSGRNYYVYDLPATGKFEWIVWDASLSFGAYPGGVSSTETLNLNYISSVTNRPLVAKVINTPVLDNEYLRAYCTIFKTYFSSARLNPQIDSIANLIRPSIYEDTRKQYSNSQWEANLINDINVNGRKPGLKSFISLRQANVQTQLTNLGISCNVAVSPGDVVINEFMAQNTLIPDPAGEFEDWIEIHNKTANEVDLTGMYLTDDYTNPTKWQFPAGSTMAPNSYIIVWADEDGGQPGYHASFKLSADGEKVRLSNIDVSMLDSTTFGAQTVNLSMARMPNGTGAFVQGPPSFNANNNPTGIVNEITTPEKFELYQNYPNPFNPVTNIKFGLPFSSHVKLTVYDITGKTVSVLVNELRPSGFYEVSFDASRLASGIYFYKLHANGIQQIKKMTVIK
jgi:hypothetical protein